ncbi:MAG: ammonium transporter [bacterium]
MDIGNTGFLLICAAFVFIMTPALALFYGGMSRKKNVLNTIMMSFIVLGIVSVEWILYGYSLAFGQDINGLIGSLNFVGLSGVGLMPNPDYIASVPHLLFMAFQMMFALITAALISGSVVGRMRFSAYVLFIFLWTSIVYNPLAHWVWGVGGWIREMGALDFAGGTVVHISSGITALVLCMLLGKRKPGLEMMIPHNLPMTVLGAGLLWIGWFGFNGGSALGANEIAVNAFVTTHISASAAIISWALVEIWHHGKPTMLGVASGCIAGLVVVTPACGFVTPLAALFMGLLVSPVCYFAVSVAKVRLGYDDALDAFGIHGVGGTLGALLTGIFATKAVNPDGADGLLASGSFHLLWVQFVSVIATMVLAAVATYILYKAVNCLFKARVSEGEEYTGLDFTQHGENAYDIDSLLR